MTQPENQTILRNLVLEINNNLKDYIMDKKQEFVFSVDHVNRKIHVEKEFPAPLDKVWDAFTKEEQLSRWFAPEPWKVESKQLDFNEGGRWLFAMVGPEGEKHWSIVDYISIDPMKSYTAKDAFSDDKGNINQDMPQATWHNKFIDQGSSTRYQVDISFDSEEDLDGNLNMGFVEGYTACLNQLADLLA